MTRASASVLVAFALCQGCSTLEPQKEAEARAASLGFPGCRASKALTTAEIVDKEKSSGTYVESQAAWKRFVAKVSASDQIFFIDCRGVGPDRVVVGSTMYVLVRNGAELARFGEVIID